MRNQSMSTKRLRITGMTCDHCARTVEDALNGLPGVKAQVFYLQGIANIQASEDLSTEQLLQVVKVNGFGANLLEGQP
jgi:mercuric reductase